VATSNRELRGHEHDRAVLQIRQYFSDSVHYILRIGAVVVIDWCVERDP